MQPAKIYTVGALSKVLGVSSNTVRAWETRYGAVAPDRTATNRRVYSSHDLKRLKLILNLINSGHSIGSVAHLSDNRLLDLQRNAERLGRISKVEVSSAIVPMLQALEEFNLKALFDLMEQSRVSHSIRDYALEIISPLMGKVGLLVAKGEISIAQEHALSAIVRDQIGQMALSLRRTSRSKDNDIFLFTTPEGDLHEFGILLGASLCLHYGHSAYYLGPNLPVDALVMAAKSLKPYRIILGNSHSEKATDGFLESYLRELGKSLPSHIEVWIGGSGELPHLRAVFGKRKHRVLRSLVDFDERIRPPSNLQ